MDPGDFTCSPSLTQYTPPQRVNIGDPLVLECKFEGNPMPEAFWTGADGKNLTEDDNLKISTVEEGSEYLGVLTTRLDFSSLEAPQVENVECRASNTVGGTSQVVRVSLTSALGDSNMGNNVRLSDLLDLLKSPCQFLAFPFTM